MVNGATIEDSVVQNNGHGIVMVGVDGVSIVNNRVSGHRREATSGGRRRRHRRRRRDAATISTATSAGSSAAGRRAPSSRGTRWWERDPTRAVGASADANGIVCLGPSSSAEGACIVAGNTVRRCAGSGVVAQQVSLVSLQDNTIEEVGQRAVLLRATSRSEVAGNP